VGEGADRPVDRGLLQQPARLFLERLNRVDPVPDDVIWRNGSDGFDDCLVAAENCEEVAVADDLDRPFGGAPQQLAPYINASPASHASISSSATVKSDNPSTNTDPASIVMIRGPNESDVSPRTYVQSDRLLVTIESPESLLRRLGLSKVFVKFT
jgi:hypothetical protein